MSLTSFPRFSDANSDEEKEYRKRFNLMERPGDIGEECNLGGSPFYMYC